jgi:sRNA-binding carbon storage regulator CsrA
MLVLRLKPGRCFHLVTADGRTVTVHGDAKVASRVAVDAPADVVIVRDDHIADGETPAAVVERWRTNPRRRAA